MSIDTLAIDLRNWTAHVIVLDQHCKKTRVVSTELGQPSYNQIARILKYYSVQLKSGLDCDHGTP